jgi:MerR family transcriptional regulator, copper efflux regulator
VLTGRLRIRRRPERRTLDSEAARTLFQIGEVADRVGLSLRTIRYYEEVGLVAPASRTAGGFRLYSEANVGRLAILKGMKPLGFSLSEVRELMSLLDRTAGAEEFLAKEIAEVVERLNDFSTKAADRVESLAGYLREAKKLAGIIEERRRELRALEAPSQKAAPLRVS